MTTQLATKNTDTVASIYEAFGQGNIPFILEQLREDVGWICHFDPIVPWGGDRRGKEAVADFFASIDSNVDVLGFEPQEFVTEGDTVVSTGTFSCRGKATGKEVTTRWVFIWKFQDGLIASYEQFHDQAITDVFRD